MAQELVGDLDLSAIKTRSLSGVVTLISRSVVLQIVSTIGFFLLSIYLGLPEIGLFIAVNDLVSILGYFSDIGLAASLIQKRDSVSITDLRTTFTIQQTIVLFLIGITLIISPWLISYYHISGGGQWLLYSLLLAFFLASLKTIPSVVLERQLKFEVLASVEVIENILFYVVAVFLAWQGAGVMAYAWAVVLRGLIGTAMIYYLAPWKIGLAFSKTSLKHLLSFGLPFQFNSLMAVVKDRFLNIFLWKIIGASGVAVIGWSQTWSQKPLRFIMDNVTKVTFPSFARMQDHPAELRSAIEKTLFFITFITFPVLVILMLGVPFLINLVPKWEKWEIAIVPLMLYCFNSAFAAVSTPLTNTLNALGKVKINTYLMIMWTALTWVLTPLLAIRYGFMGVAYATAIIAVSSVVPIIIVKKLTHFSLTKSVVNNTIAALLGLVVGYGLSRLLSINWINLVLIELAGGMVFLVSIYILEGPRLVSDVKGVWNVWRKK